MEKNAGKFGGVPLEKDLTEFAIATWQIDGRPEQSIVLMAQAD